MRRDVVRVGIGRLLFEVALGVVLVGSMSETLRIGAMLAALAAALAAHLASSASGSRRAFVAAHVALFGAALGAHLPLARAPLVAAALGAAIELTHVDLVQRRRLTESVRSLRVPSSLIVRRLGSMVIVAAGGRISLGVVGLAARPEGLPALVIVLGAMALLAAGFGAGPGRPAARPFDAAAFVLLGLALVLRF